MPTIRPFHSNLVVEDFQLGEISRGGLLIPQIAKASTPYRFAKVIAVGPGRYAADGTLVPCSAKVNDVIAYAKNAGNEFPLDDENGDEKVYRLINESFVMGAVDDLPERSLLTGLDGKLLRMNPNSRAPSDIADEQGDRIERATKQGIIDSNGDTLARIAAMDQQEAEAES